MNTISKLVDIVYKDNVYLNDEKKKIYSRIDGFLKLLRKILLKHKIDAEVFLGGSSAKDTFLKGKFDSDVFVRFNYEKYKVFSNELSDIIEKPISEISKNKYNRVHGSRDYYIYIDKASNPSIKFEVIPVLKIDNPLNSMNITDVSPLHVIWAKKYLTKSNKLVKEIVATKLFMKSIGVYGAESYIRGFSGHDVDILIFYYKSFENLLKSAIVWEKHQVIDLEKHYSDKKTVISKLNPSKISPLLLIDPVQPERNAAASLSTEKFELFKLKALEFLSNPKPSYFIERKFSLSGLKKTKIENCKKIIYFCEPLEGKQDVVGSKLLKCYEHIKKRFKSSGFDVFDSDWFWDKSDKAHFWYYITIDSIQNLKTNPFYVHKGPPTKKELDAKKFREKHISVYEEDSFLFTKVKREFNSIERLSNHILREKYVLERVRKIKEV